MSTQSVSPDALEQTVMANREAQRQISQHWLAAAAVITPMILVVLAVQMAWLPVFFQQPESGGVAVAVPILIGLIVHAFLCLAALGITMGSVKNLRAEVGSDAARVEQVVNYLKRRRTFVVLLAWLGQLVVIFSGFYGYSFAAAPWMLLPLVPSFLLISLTLRQPPTMQRLATYVRRMRMIQQTKDLGSLSK